MAGRPTKLTKELIDRMVLAIQAGNYAKVAAQLCGIGESTYYAWLAEARKEGADPLFLEFLESVEQAEAAAEVEAVALIRQSARNGNTRDAQWLLERKHAERWGRNDKIRQEITGADGGPIELSVEEVKKAILAFLDEGENGVISQGQTSAITEGDEGSVAGTTTK